MSALFACADPGVAGGILLPSDRVELLQLLHGLPAGTLVCTTPSAGRPAAELRRCLRAGVRPDVRTVALSLPPTVVPVVASVLADGAFPAGAVSTVTAEVVAACTTVAVVGGVGGLEDPAPSVLQHALGWLPGMRFGIRARTGTVRARWTPQALDGADAALTVVATSGDPASGRWRDRLESANPAPRRIRTDAEGPGCWGARRWAELTAVPMPVDELAGWLHSRVRIVSCPWCGSGVSADGCPFCGIVPARSSRAGAGGRAAPPPSARTVPARSTGSVSP